MNGSFKLGNAFGIPVHLHWTFFLLVYFVVVTGEQPAIVSLSLLTAVVGSVLLHELGHSLMARRFGIRVLDITFWPLGGMARMAEVPEDAKIEGLVAVAGPAVNFVLAAVGVGGMALSGLLGAGDAYAATAWFVGINLMLGTFNLIPAFPMDGGRLLRAWFARSTDWVTATEQAVRVGRFFAFLMLLAAVAFFQLGLCVLPLIAAFVWWAGARELMAVRLRHGRFPFGSPAGAAGAATAAARPAQPLWTSPAPTPEVEPDESTRARRPADPDEEVPRGGFSDDFVRDLERSHGRLRPPRDLEGL